MGMEIKQNKTVEPNILYELLTLAEWNYNFDINVQKVASNNAISRISVFNPWKIFTKQKFDNKRFLQTEYPWQFAVGQDGKVVAILQESLLEIRTAKDEFSSVVGRAPIPPDQNPHLRKIAWSPDNTFVAVARDNGIVNVYNLLGGIVATVYPGVGGNTNTGINNSSNAEPVVGLIFLQPKFRSTNWSYELFVFYFNGEVKSVLLSTLDGCDSVENCNCSLEQYFPQGITCVAYHSLHNIIIIGGSCPSKESGISVWRVLNDYPYLKVVFGFEKNIPISRSLVRLFAGYSRQVNSNTVIKMQITPNGEVLACLHYSGAISLWQLPGIRMIQHWSLSQLPFYNRINVTDTERVNGEEYFYPVDICWWSDSALVIARRSGSITVTSITTLKNLLGDSPEYLSCSPQISSVQGPRSAVIALECETEHNKYKITDIEATDSDPETSALQASLQAALYSFTDIERFEPKRKTPRITQRTYRLLVIKQTTPEELYGRKIELEDYDSALLLAQTYNLDCDLVYQKQWRSSTVNVWSIYNFLDKINNIFWVINECIERVPDTVEAANELLQFGLKKTNLHYSSTKKLDSQEKKIVSLRRQILLFADSLSLYQKIIRDPATYDAREYDRFRRNSALSNTVRFARLENWLAVSIMLTYKGNEVLEYRLPILSNFPETMFPQQYRSLLPEIIDNEVIPWDVKRLRTLDWCEEMILQDIGDKNGTSFDHIYENDSSLARFQGRDLTPAMVEEWFIRRTYEIEKNTGLVDYALCFATLGKERNIKNLDQILFNLKTLHCLVYTVQKEDMTLAKLEGLSILEQSKILLSNTDESNFVENISNIIYPFASRCEQQGCSTFYSVIEGILLWLSEDNLNLPLKFFECLKEDNRFPFKLSITQIMSLALDCLYSCRKFNEVNNGFSILECLPVRGMSMTSSEEDLHDKTDKLEKHLEVCEILERYNIFKPLHYIRDNEENETIGIQLMEDMAKFTRDETLDFSDLLCDLQRLQSDMFPNIHENFCYELVAFTQMSCKHENIIMLTEELLQCNKADTDKPISFEKSVKLCLEAAKIHIEKATNYDDVGIQFAQTCLNLISEPDPQICEELDFIESLQLLQDFKVNLLPLQVRKCINKISLIESCLQTTPNAFKSHHRLMQLARALRIYGEDRRRREGEVLLLLAKYALKSLDYEFCSEMCDRLVVLNFSPAWHVACELAQEDAYGDIIRKKDYLAFGVLHCPIENVENLIEYRLCLNSNEFPKMDINPIKEECP